MKKAAVVYWSGTGNTRQMAQAVLEGMAAAGMDCAVVGAAPMPFAPAYLMETAAELPGLIL